MSYLSIEDYQKLRGMRFAPRKPPRGQHIGLHDSPVQGFNVEFSEYRAYNPGDDVKRLDWKVFGRTNRLMVKRHEHQTSLKVTFLIDASPSMMYKGAEKQPLGFRRLSKVPPPLTQRAQPSKFDHACRMALALGFVLLQQKDRVAFGVMRDGLQSLSGFRSSFRHLVDVDRTLQQASNGPAVAAGIPEALETFQHRVSRRSLVYVFSDFLERERDVMQQARILRSRGDEVGFFHVLHEDELSLPDHGPVLLRDSETGATLPLTDASKRRRYQQNLTDYLDGFKASCKREGVDYQLVSTATPSHEAIQHYVTGRVALR